MSNKLRILVTLLCLSWSVLGTAQPARAQSESGASAVEGKLVDAAGAPVSGATISLKNVSTGYLRSVSTTADGRFAALAMPVGDYVIETSSSGQTAKVTASLRVGATAAVSLKLGAMVVTEEVTVSATAAGLDTTETAASTSVPLKAINDLPIRGRNFPEFVQLTPGVMQESDRSGLVVSGQRSINSNVSIDGADFNDPLQGNQRGGNETTFFFPQSAVNQFQVVRSGATAEVGRTSAGFVNVVTKSGTNTLHGEGFYFNRNKKMSSADAFDQKLNNAQNQFGGAAGGALSRDRAFFFGAAEQNFIRVPFVVKFQTQAAGVVLPDSLKALEGEKSGSNNPTALFGRLDYTVSATQSLNVQGTYSRLTGRNFNFDSPQQDTAETTNYTRRNRSQGVKASWLSVLSPSMLNEIKGQIATDNRREEPNVNSPSIVITGVGSIGGDSGRPRIFENTRYQFSDNLTIVNGRHQIRVGLDINVTPSQQQRESNVQGRFDYTSLANYIKGTISRYRQTVPGFDPADLVYKATQKEAGLFIQDRISVGDATISLGFRWDGQWNPVPPRPNPKYSVTSKIPNDLKMFQPRAGITWKVAGSPDTILRVSAGLYAARTPANLFQRVFTDNGFSTVAVDSRTDATILPLVANGQPLTVLPVGTKIPVQRIFGFDPSFQNPRTVQVAASVDHQFAGGFTVSLSYTGAHTDHLQRRLDKNLFAPTYNAAGTPIFPSTRPDTTIAQLEVNESTARSNYNAVSVTGSIRRAKVFAQVNYTLAYNKDDDSNERNFSREVTLDPFNLGAEYTWSKQDIRHNMNASLALNLGAGFTAGGIVMARSGMPYTAVIGSDQQGDGNDDNDQAIINGKVAGRNSFRQPNFFNLDLRLQKSIGIGRSRIDLSLEVFNATRATNKHFGNDAISVFGTTASPVATAGQPLFAPSTARFGGPRQMQLGARISF